MRANERLTYQNKHGQSVSFQHERPFYLLEKTGFSEVQNKISSLKLYNFDGEWFSDSSLDGRDLSFKGVVKGLNPEDTHKLHSYLISVFNPQSAGKLIYENYGKRYEIDVQVTKSWSDSFDLKTMLTTGSVQFRALSTFWRDTSSGTNIQSLASTKGLLTFPLKITDNFMFEKPEVGKPVEIVNNGHADIGFVLTMRFSGDVLRPKVVNIYTNEEFGFRLLARAGDRLVLDTRKGYKSMTFNGQNAYDQRTQGAKFLQLPHAQKTYLVLRAEAGLENVEATIEYYPLLVGV